MQKQVIFKENRLGSRDPGFWEKFLQMEVLVYPGHWSMDIKVIGLRSYDEQKTLFETRIRGNSEDYFLAKCINDAENSTANDIAYQFFFDYIIKPSLSIPEGEKNWFKKHAPDIYDFHMASQDRENREVCKEVHDV